jgi:hypothetical protein
MVELDPNIAFLYRGRLYSVAYFYDTFIRNFYEMIDSKKVINKLKLREIPLFDGDVIIFGVTNVNKFIDFLIEYFIRFIYNLRGKEQSFVWDMYVMCYPNIILQKLKFHMEHMFAYYDFVVLNPYIRFNRTNTDSERMEVILKNAIAGVLNYVIGVSENEFREKNSICER